MREIKFRAWDKESGIWLDDDYFIICPYNGVVIEIDYVDGRVVLDEINHDVIIEQYTGLKDKNGVEIYENDIVQYGNNKHDNCVVKFGEFGVPEIESEQYVDRAVGFYLKSIGDLKDVAPFNMTIPLNERYAKGYQVIGNIHQNKNLLVNDADRISSDDIGNDIHEFLHGGDK